MAAGYLLRDRDAVYGDPFLRRVESTGIAEVLTAARSPWQNPCVERVIGSIRRECLDQVVVLGERHLRRILVDYLEHYHLALSPVAGDGLPGSSTCATCRWPKNPSARKPLKFRTWSRQRWLHEGSLFERSGVFAARGGRRTGWARWGVEGGRTQRFSRPPPRCPEILTRTGSSAGTG
jgi:Integrase core domain